MFSSTGPTKQGFEVGNSCFTKGIPGLMAQFIMALRWAPFFNSLELVIHGCVDGFSRRIIYLKCNSNNLSETVLDLFLDAVKRDGDRWPSRIRVDRGVENVLVCDAMIQYRGEGRASFIAGPSTHNQRIERLWREVYRCVCHLYYYTFYAMESSGILNVEDPIQLFALHTIFIPRVNNSLREFSEAFNNHAVSTEGNWTPYQIWMNGMMHANNPLAHGDVDGEPDDIQFYGYDPEGPLLQKKITTLLLTQFL